MAKEAESDSRMERAVREVVRRRQTECFRELHREVCKFTNVLKRNHIKKGDRIIIYMPMCPEAAIAMLACARLGAIHSVVFGGFNSESIKDRIKDSQARMVITADGGYRRGAIVQLKKNVDEALTDNEQIERVIVFRRAHNEIHIKEDREVWWHREMEYIDGDCPPGPMDSEDPLFILYTSASRGQVTGDTTTLEDFNVLTKLGGPEELVGLSQNSGVAGVQELQNETAAFRSVDGD